MATTIRQQPARGYFPTMNPCIYVVSSTNSAQPNFQYVCDLYFTDDNGAKTIAGRSYLRTKAPVDPVYSSGVFDISPMCRNFVSYDIGDDIYGWQKCPNGVIAVTPYIGEEYGPSSGVTVTASAVALNSQFFIGASIDPLEFNSTDWKTKYIVSNTVTTDVHALTYRPQGGKIRATERAWLHYFTDLFNSIYNARIRTYDNAGALTATYYVDNPYKLIGSVGKQFVRFPAGPSNLQAISSSLILSGQASIDFNGIYSYDICTVNATSGVTSSPETYTVDQDCVQDYPVYRLHFQNKLGGFDSFSFTQASQFSTDVKRDNFKRNTITRIGGGRYGYNNSTESNVQFNTMHKDKVKITSNWIDEDTSEWLEELVTSPVVFLDDATYGLVAVKVTDANYIRRQWRTDGLSNLELTIEYSFDRLRQSQ